VRGHDLVIVDQNVALCWMRDLPEGFVSLPFSEASKNLTTVAKVMAVLHSRHQPDSKVFVVGGGVAGDVVGFAAGLLGLRCCFIPTTLLSMADSSIGGKVGVNFEPWGKNQIGLFNHPWGVRIWPGWLKSLDDKELKSGIVECLKHALISGDRDLWSLLAKRETGLRISDDILEAIIKIKSDIVKRDPYESGERAILNFGHTLGHALETRSSERGIKVTHGECVAIGMIHALRLSMKYRGMKASTYVADLLNSGVVMSRDTLIGINCGNASPKDLANELINLMSRDKKATTADGISFALMDALGKAARAEGGSWVIHFSRQDALADLEETLIFLLSLSY
jgi:3-dehydroquinate synthase